MLKNIRNNFLTIRFRYDENYKCTPYKDCSAHDAAKLVLDAANKALETATTDYNNAVELQNSLKEEQSTASQMMDNYKTVYDVLNSVGPSVANPQNMMGLSGIIDCVCNYGKSVETAYNQAVDEVSRCEQEIIKCQNDVNKAKTKLENTPCVWRCR